MNVWVQGTRAPGLPKARTSRDAGWEGSKGSNDSLMIKSRS